MGPGNLPLQQNHIWFIRITYAGVIVSGKIPVLSACFFLQLKPRYFSRNMCCAGYLLSNKYGKDFYLKRKGCPRAPFTADLSKTIG